MSVSTVAVISAITLLQGYYYCSENEYEDDNIDSHTNKRGKWYRNKGKDSKKNRASRRSMSHPFNGPKRNVDGPSGILSSLFYFRSSTTKTSAIQQHINNDNNQLQHDEVDHDPTIVVVVTNRLYSTRSKSEIPALPEKSIGSDMHQNHINNALQTSVSTTRHLCDSEKIDRSAYLQNGNHPKTSPASHQIEKNENNDNDVTKAVSIMNKEDWLGGEKNMFPVGVEYEAICDIMDQLTNHEQEIIVAADTTIPIRHYRAEKVSISQKYEMIIQCYVALIRCSPY
jgi:hypothetical protein